LKISHIEIDGFRAFGDKRELAMKGGKSLCLFAENGRGKSSVADALEFWSTGDVDWTHRDGVGLSALVHLDRKAAVVEVRVDGVGVVSRALNGRKAGPLIAAPAAAGFRPEGLPILRHRTMAGFVEKSANDKRGELLHTLGLSSLAEFRKGVRSTAQKLKRLEKEAIQQLLQANRGLDEELAGKPLSERLRQLSREAGLAAELSSESELMDWQPESMAVNPAGRRELDPVETLVELSSVLSEGPPSEWEEAVTNRDAAEQRGLSLLLDAGQGVIANSVEDRCPLCLVEQDRDRLLEQVTARAAEMAESDRAFGAAEDQMRKHELTIERLQQAIDACLDSDNPRLKALGSDLEILQGRLDEYAERLRAAAVSRSAIEGDPPKLGDETLEELRQELLSGPVGIGPAVLRLSKLKGRAQAKAQAHEQALEAAGKHEAAVAAAEIADAHVEKAVQQALDHINEPLFAYYAALVGKPVYTDLKLTYTASRAGGIEFTFKWDGRKEVNPPQRVMSESELNALGLALFLARLKTDPPAWKTMILDDVITSFDDVHQARLIRLLTTDFADWQVLLLTHDQQLSRTVAAEAPGWKDEKVIAWTPREGPSFGAGSMRARLEEKLDAGEPAAELGGLARQAIEEALERPLRRMGLKIRHDPQSVYSAEEYRQALIEGLTSGGFPKAGAPVLQRLQSTNSITNRACHYKDNMPSITEADLRVLLDDIEELDQIFICDGCGKRAWAVSQRGSTRCQCNCGTLSCA
jgi:recombinational DNA repair ATPase RecF